MSKATAARDAAADQTRLRDVKAAIDTGDLDRAGALAEAALADGLEHPMLLNLSAFRLEREGKVEQALARLIRAREISPADVSVLNGLGLTYMTLKRHEEALEAFTAAVEAAPTFAPALANKGGAEEVLGRIAEARTSYAAALAIQPDHPAALAGLSAVAARQADYETARDYAAKALAAVPGIPSAVMALASAEQHAGELAAAERRLRGLLLDPRADEYSRAVAHGQLGDVLDAADRRVEAFSEYQASNDAFSRLYGAQLLGRGAVSVLDVTRSMIGYFERAPVWRAEASPDSPDGAATHVFMVGFPRSGTTLLEQVLASHPDVVALEENESLALGARAYLRGTEGLARLAAATETDLAPLRADYWRLVREAGVDPAGKVFIDKFPLNTLKLPLIYKLFPKAKILFARRDPRDVVLSCFRRRFRMNPSMFQFVTLEGTAAFYDATMSLAELMRPRLPFDLRVARHEDLVDDFDAEAGAICGFLGLGFDERMRSFAERVKDRSVGTPSAQQVAKGLNRDGLGQWRRYAPQMQRVLPTLNHWVQRFGYAP